MKIEYVSIALIILVTVVLISLKKINTEKKGTSLEQNSNKNERGVFYENNEDCRRGTFRFGNLARRYEDERVVPKRCGSFGSNRAG